MGNAWVTDSIYVIYRTCICLTGSMKDRLEDVMAWPNPFLKLEGKAYNVGTHFAVRICISQPNFGRWCHTSLQGAPGVEAVSTTGAHGTSRHPCVFDLYEIAPLGQVFLGGGQKREVQVTLPDDRFVPAGNVGGFQGQGRRLLQACLCAGRGAYAPYARGRVWCQEDSICHRMLHGHRLQACIQEVP